MSTDTASVPIEIKSCGAARSKRRRGAVDSSLNRCNGEIHVRSIQQVHPDGSLSFYCAIEEGMVLAIGGHEVMHEALERDVDALVAKIGQAELFLACNCILRALEADKLKAHEDLAAILGLDATLKERIGRDQESFA